MQTTDVTTDNLRPQWLTAERWAPEINIVQSGEYKIAYSDVGDGPTIVLVHTGMRSFLWRDLIELLRGSFRVVSFDAPGTGLSDGPRRVELSHAADALSALVEKLDLRDFVIIAHDLGAPVSLEAAARWPERVAGLVIANGFGWRPSGPVFRGMLALIGGAPMREIDAWTGWLPRLATTKMGIGRHLEKADRRAFVRGMPRTGRRNMHRYMKSARRHDYSAIDATVKQLSDRPTLTVFGKKNDQLKFQPKWAARFSRIRQIEVQNGHHFPMCDDPQLVADSISDWYASEITTRDR